MFFLKVSCCKAFKWNPFAVLSKGFRLRERERERQRGHIYEGKKVDNGGGEEDEEDKEKNQEMSTPIIIWGSAADQR